MGYCLGYALVEGGDAAFSMDAASVTFGPGSLKEVGAEAKALGMRRVALFTDARLARLAAVATVKASLEAAGLDVEVYDEVRVEPTQTSFIQAAAFAAGGRFDGFVSVGGGSVIDTCKAALLYATYPADFYAYVNRPLGEGREVPGPLPPHIACPTTTGTGSENTGIAIFDDTSRKAKTGIVSRRIRPTRAIVDPHAARTSPPSVIAASGFDVVSHALESYTALAFSSRARPETPTARPLSQGKNPWSDMGCERALGLAGRFLVRAAQDPADDEAIEGMAWAATLAGIAFGNAGCHLPHAMSYAISGLCRSFTMPGYPEGEPMVPHGIAVIVNAPSVFRALSGVHPERLVDAARMLGADVRGAGPLDGGEILATHLLSMMKKTGVPNGISGVGYNEADIDALTAGTFVQKRLVLNAPRVIDEDFLKDLFRAALAYW